MHLSFNRWVKWRYW